MWFITCTVSLLTLWIKELFRDHTMDDFYKSLSKGLRGIGIDARVSRWDRDTRVVEIRGSPIARVNLEKELAKSQYDSTNYYVCMRCPMAG